jgi:hypothetical protein
MSACIARATSIALEPRANLAISRPREPRNADVAAVAEYPAGRIAFSIAAKADEPFDRPVRDVLAAADARLAAGERTNSRLRAEQLLRALVPADAPSDELRYQLLTAAAGAIAFAIEQQASRAVLVVHEFHSGATRGDRTAANQQALDHFVNAVSGGRYASLYPGQLVGPIRVAGVPLFEQAVPLFIGKAVRQLD